MFSRTKVFTTLALALILPMAACDGGTDPSFGSVSLMLTDANESEISQAWVRFTDIYLQGGGAQGDEADPEASRQYLVRGAAEDQEFELTTLAGDVATLVDGAIVPTGHYGQLRVVVADACIVTPDGVFSSSDDYATCGEPTGRINLTSTGTSGWKVLLNGLTVDGSQEIVLLDFVVDESFFRESGGTGNAYTLNPVIKGADLSLSGGFAVTLADPDGLLDGATLDEFSVTMRPAEGDAQTVAFAQDGENAPFLAAFEYEMPGQAYEFTLESPAGLTVTVSPASPATLELASGETGRLDWVITDVTAN